MIPQTDNRLPCSIRPQLFHPPHGERADSDQARRRIATAKALCARCPLRQTCRNDDDGARPRGIRGGETEPEWRARLTRNRLLATHTAQV
ncbi:transcription factor WhiB [Streptomyces sp. TLI_235]|nr:WhiB family transcriptional regulator [Streptomyces sp. TLI_235]PBC80158.1 transcription factor WhiB [Streptomyces sp. TLI_235]